MKLTCLFLFLSALAFCSVFAKNITRDHLPEHLAVLKALNNHFHNDCSLLGSLRKLCFSGGKCKTAAQCKVILHARVFANGFSAWDVIKGDLPVEIQ